MQSDAPRLYVVSGAGLSAESGVATFRTQGGIWATADINEVCNYDTWQANRAAVFDFYRARAREMTAAKPNDAHQRLAQWQSRWGTDRVRLLTQNVDHLLEDAGATAVTHLHGDMRDLRCVDCDHLFRVLPEANGPLTPCPKCAKVDCVKPGVIFFNERSEAYDELREMKEALRPEDIVLVVGTSLLVISAEQLFPRRRFGHSKNWQVNPEPDRSEWFGLNHRSGAVEGLQALEARLAAWMDDYREVYEGSASVQVAPTTPASRTEGWLRNVRKFFAR